MRRVHRPLLVLHPDPGLKRRVFDACGDDYAYEEVADWDALEAALPQAPPSVMLLVDPVAGDGGASERLHHLLRAFPSTPVIATFEASPERHELLRTLGRWGVVQVITPGHDDTAEGIRRRLMRARSRPMRALLESVLPPETSGRARAILDAAADIVTVGAQGQDLADALNLSRRTLLRWTERAGLPPSRRLLAWMRILLACELLDDPGRPIFGVARAAGYASDSGLRRVTQTFLGASPTELRRRGAVRTAAPAFAAALEESRMAFRVMTREG